MMRLNNTVVLPFLSLVNTAEAVRKNNQLTVNFCIEVNVFAVLLPGAIFVSYCYYV